MGGPTSENRQDKKNATKTKDLKRARAGLAVLAVGLIISGLTCYFLPAELGMARRAMEAMSLDTVPLTDEMYAFVVDTEKGVLYIERRHPQMFLGTDYLGFAHVILGILFLGAMKGPGRNLWVIEFGVLCCILVIPAAFIFCYIRGAPLLHYFVDSSFGVVALMVMVPVWKSARRLDERASEKK